MRAARLGWGRLFAYGAPAVGYSFYLFFVQFYYLKFATDVLLAAPLAVGLLFGAGRVWDAVSDPLVGYLSDRTRTGLGRRRPWMLAAVPLLAVFFVMVWHPPASLSDSGLVLWAAVSLFGFYTAFTMYIIPHQSLGAELSTDHHERSRIFGAQRMAFVLGMLLAFGGIGYVTNASDTSKAIVTLAIGSALAVSVLLLLTPAALRERVEYQGRAGGNPYATLRDVLRNRHARILLTVWFAEGLGGGVLGVLAPFLTEYVIKRPDLIAVVPAFFVLANIASIPMWIALSRRFGKRNVWLVAFAGQATFFGGTFFVLEGQLTLLAVLLVGAGMSSGCGGVIGTSMLADAIDYDELESGERKEGAYSAAWGFALKSAIGIVIVLTGAVLHLSGFQPNVEQSYGAELALRGLFAGAPFVASLTALFLLRRFSLDAVEHARIRAALDERGADFR